MNTSTKPRPNTMSLDDMIHELAKGLRDVIDETPMEELESDPEAAFIDLASRLIFRLRAKLTVVPASERAESAAAAQRIFEILTQWMIKNPGCSYRTRTSASGKFQISATSASGTNVFFGESSQDAYAQMAQAVHFGGGVL